jgi:signal transduction histidine kinase
MDILATYTARNAMNRRIKKFLSAYQSLFIVIVAAVILGFQAYWLYNQFHDQKNRITSELRNRLNDIVVKENLAFVKSLTGPRAAKLAGAEKILTQMSHVSMKSEIRVYMDTFSRKLPQQPGSSVRYDDTEKYLSGLKSKVAAAKSVAGVDYRLCTDDCEGGDGAIVIRADNPLLRTGRTCAFVISDLNKAAGLKMLPALLLSVVYLLICLGTLAMLRKNFQDAQKLLLMKRIFTTNMTHELQTPLATLATAVESLDKYEGRFDPALTKDYLGVMQGEIFRLGNLIDNMLFQSKLDVEQTVLKLRPVLVAAVLESAIERFGNRLSQRNAKLDFSPGEPGLLVNGDFHHLSNAFANLIDNAIKYSPVEVDISVEASRGEESVRIAVKDKGAGIPQKYLGQIFDAYFRVPEEAQNSYAVKGHGLGLSYVRSIVDLHGGRILVESVKGKGTVFTIQLQLSHE